MLERGSSSSAGSDWLSPRKHAPTCPLVFTLLTITACFSMPYMDKYIILSKLAAFVSQRPGLQYADYNDAKAYRSELRSITKYYAPCLLLISQAHSDDSLTPDMIIETAKQTFGGRLSWNANTLEWDYIPGQYFPTEYRAAA